MLVGQHPQHDWLEHIAFSLESCRPRLLTRIFISFHYFSPMTTHLDIELQHERTVTTPIFLPAVVLEEGRRIIHHSDRLCSMILPSSIATTMILPQLLPTTDETRVWWCTQLASYRLLWVILMTPPAAFVVPSMYYYHYQSISYSGVAIILLLQYYYYMLTSFRQRVATIIILPFFPKQQEQQQLASPNKRPRVK